MDFFQKKQLAVLAIFVVVFTAIVFVLQGMEDNKAGVVLGATKEQTVYVIPLTTEEPRGAIVSPKSADTVNATKFNAKAVLVYEPDSDTILFSQNSEKQLPIASLTKLMTAIVSIENPSYAQPITITAADQLSVSPSLYFKVGDTVAPEDVLKAMLLGSANDAALTLANHLPNKAEFVSVMNIKAQELGMVDTKFSNPMGFDSLTNYSTAADLKKLVRYGLNTLPYDQIWQSQRYSFKSKLGYTYSIKSSSPISSLNPAIRSVKTGFSAAAMENMIATVEVSEGRKVVVILLGSKDREGEMQQVAAFVTREFIFEK